MFGGVHRGGLSRSGSTTCEGSMAGKFQIKSDGVSEHILQQVNMCSYQHSYLSERCMFTAVIM